MKILLLTRYGPLGASSRVRCLQYLPALQAAGMDITVEPLLGDDYVRGLYQGRIPWRRVAAGYARRLGAWRRIPNFDLIWLQKEALPWLPGWVEARLLGRKVPVVIDYDDAWYHRYESHRHGIVRRLLANKVGQVVRRAAVVVVGNESLAERMRDAGAKCVEILPSVVDVGKYPPSAKPTTAGRLTIGWIGSPATAHYLKSITPVLQKMAEVHDVRVVAVGARADQMRGLPIEARPWSLETEVREIGGFDIGIMPLPDEPFERGKCGYKLIQCMAAGVPVVASPVGANAAIVRDGVEGCLATTHPEWLQALQSLAQDPARRERMGNAGRLRVAENYSLQACAPKLTQLLRSAAADKPEGW